MLYRMRFIFAADLCGAWSSFGGIAAQLNNLSLILHLATTESIAAALLYDGLLSAHLEEMARPRAERPAAVIGLSELLSVEQTRFKLQAIAQAAKTPAVEKVEKVEMKQKVKKEVDPPANKPPGWLPKQEYLAKLAAERADDQKKKDTYRKSAQRSRSHSERRERTPKRGRTPVRETMKRQRRRN